MSVVALAPAERVRDFPGQWQAFRDTALQAGLEVREDPSLGRPGVLAFEFRLDDTLAVYDFSEFILVEGPWQDYDHWFKREFTSGHLPYLNLHSFPSAIVYCDWAALRASRQQHVYRPGMRILHKQALHRVAACWPFDDLYERRLRARTLLTEAFGDRVDARVEPTQAEFFRVLSECLVSVHIPGINRNILDRGIQQAWALGVCTISPPLQTMCGPDTPEPWEHFVPIRNDFADLVERVHWCDAHRAECLEIGRRARHLYDRSIDPSSAWKRVSLLLGR